MMLVGLVAVAYLLVSFVLDFFPLMNSAGWLEFIANASNVWGWLMALNGALPVVELMAGLGVLLGVVTVLYVVMTIRRVFSLFWPGAGG